MPATLPPPLTQRRQIPAAIRSAVSGNRVREAVVCTDAPTLVYDQRSGKIVLEALLTEGATWRDPAPLLLDHQRQVAAQVGSASNFRREPNKIVATLRLARTQAADEAWDLVQGGHLTDVSLGYTIEEYVDIKPGQSRTVSGKFFTAPQGQTLRVVAKFAIREISLVPIGADPKSGIRSFPSLSERTNSMPPSPLSAVPHGSIDSMRLGDLASLVLRSRGLDPPESPGDLLEQAFPRRSAGTSDMDGAGELFGLVSQWVLDGWRNAHDSLSGIYTVIRADDFLEQQLVNVTTHPRMGRVPRGGTAPEVGFGVTSTGARLMRFGLKFSMSEEDLVDGEPLGAWRVGIEEGARAARALVADLLWGTILRNPNLADGEPLFSADRGNLGAAAFTDENLRSAWGAIGGQTDQGDDGAPIHLNLQPRFVITSPQGLVRAREYIRPQVVEGAEILPRSESRLSRTGFVDPVTGELLATPNDGAWLLAAPAEQRTSIALLLLRGQTEPTVRQTPLRQGRWGMSFDVQLAAAAAAVDGKGLYYSSADG